LKSFNTFLTEAKGGIQHLEHPSDTSFDSRDSTHHAIKTLTNVLNRQGDMTRKIDDKMSFQAIRTEDGKVGVKYKGAGAKYNFSQEDIEAQHGHKPYLVKALSPLLQHMHKVLPERTGEWQGGFMSTPETREEKNGKISHTPNTISYSSPTDHPEGKALKDSKVSMVIHSELKGPDRQAHPVTSTSEFSSHPDVHLVNHVVKDEHRMLHPEDHAEVSQHLNAARSIMKGHAWDHTSGHEGDLRTYMNSTVRAEQEANTDGYKKHIEQKYNKSIEKLKTDRGKQNKEIRKQVALKHIDDNKGLFDQTFKLHGHIQKATNTLAKALDNNASHGVSTSIGGVDSGGEGYVAGGIKVVDREGFSRANAARSAILKAGKK